MTVHHPKNSPGKAALAEQVAELHATVVIQQLKALTCPVQQKEALLDRIIRIIAKHRVQE